jgi:hypothetical protein
MITLKEAQAEAGKVSTGNGKMPGSTFAVSAKACNVGGKLAQLKGSVCHKCYALKIQALRPSVNTGWTNNLDKATRLIDSDPQRWVRFMAFQIRKAYEKTGEAYHRWFDSGDLQSPAMLQAICDVARATPEIRHWLPTRETKIVKDFTGPIPDNLIVRISSPMIDDKPIAGWHWTSTVHSKASEPAGHVCPASKQGNSCGSCRACWSDDVRNISYPLH